MAVEGMNLALTENRFHMSAVKEERFVDPFRRKYRVSLKFQSTK
jgi:hypothetical protein